MAFPKILPQSKKLQRMPNPGDFALDSVVNTIFSGTIRDFVEDGHYPKRRKDGDEESRVLDYARNIVFHPETASAKIESRQEMLTAFMNSPELIKLIQDTTIPRTPAYSKANWPGWSLRFDDRIARAEGLVGYVTELAQKFPETENPQLESFRNYIIELANEGERLQSLRAALTDIEKAGTLDIKIKFLPNPYRVPCYEIGIASIEGTLSSGKKRSVFDDTSSYFGYSKFEIPYKTFFYEAVQQVKAKGGRNLLARPTPVELEIHVDQETGTVTGKATYHKLDFFGTIFSFKKKTKAVETYFEFDPREITSGDFTYAMRCLKSKEYSEFLEDFDTDIGEFAKAVVELRYLATVADYFNGLKEQGVQITMPKIAPTDSKTTEATNLIEPNLIGKVELGDIVANDVQANGDGNLYVITGPNNNGKTTYMNSLGIAQAMSQAGMMVLAQDARMSPKDNIFTHYIRPGDLVAGESRYAHELSRIMGIMKRATGDSLVLMDEPCSGTSPEDGKQEADGVFKTVGKLGATGYVTTHFHNLIDTANQLPFAGNLHCVVQNGNHNGNGDLVYTFKIADGSSNQSNGMYLARKMGADEKGLAGILTERAQKENLKLR